MSKSGVRVRWTPEMDARLIKMRTREPPSARLSVEACALELGVSPQAARKRAQQLGINARINREGAPVQHGDKVPAVIRLRQQGLTFPVIATRLGISRETAMQYWKQFGACLSP